MRTEHEKSMSVANGMAGPGLVVCACVVLYGLALLAIWITG